jgi:hypothetical protein
MSTLLEQASLVMIPSGYKEDVVYSVIPESGAGDLSFTRASDGTRINSAGLVENMPYNLLQYSQTITNGVWQTQNTTKSLEAGTTPLNTPIYKVLATGGFAQFYETNILTVGVVYSDTVLVKKGNCRYIHFRHGNFSYYDFDTNTFSGSNASIMTASDLTNGWILIKTSGYASTFANFSIYQSNNTNPYGGANGDFTYVSFCQINLGNTAKQYFATTNRQDVPQLDWEGSTCPYLNMDNATTNLIKYSDDFTNVIWLKSAGTATANTTIAPDGTTTADTFIENTTNAVHTLYQSFNCTTNTQYTFSGYVKANGRNIVRFECQATSVLYQVEFNLATGTTSNISGTGTAVITSIGNGWFRCSATITSTATGTGYWQLDLCSSAGVISYLGNGTSGIYLWGAQLEQRNIVTSYVPTGAATATRTAQTLSVNNLQTNNILSSNFTLYSEFIDYKWSNNSGIHIFGVGNATATDWLSIYRNFSSLLKISKKESNVVTDTNNLLVQVAAGNTIKVAIRCNAGTVRIYINGQIAYNTTFANPGLMTNSRFFQLDAGNLNSAKVKSILLYNTALTDTECVQLTSI